MNPDAKLNDDSDERLDDGKDSSLRIKTALDLSKDRRFFSHLLDSVKAEAAAFSEMPFLMEVCGSHTWAIAHTGIRDLLRDYVQFISGPGCPVCVTSTGELRMMVQLAQMPNTIVATYGDLLRVPTSSGSLEKFRAQGKDVRVVFSPMDALYLAKGNPDKETILLGIGFETTAPGCGVAIRLAKSQGVKNFSCYSAHKVMPPAIERVLSLEDTKVGGLLLPGHVSTITGRRYFDFIPDQYEVPSVIAGFEACDILYAVKRLLQKMKARDFTVENGYPRVVTEEGNTRAKKLLSEVFQPCRASWRGLGWLDESGLSLAQDFKSYDAAMKFHLPPPEDDQEPPGCDCHLILSGLKTPYECRLFGKGCTPAHPIGPCMVSQEGSCRAYFLHQR